jgi:hypothetical protein
VAYLEHNPECVSIAIATRAMNGMVALWQFNVSDPSAPFRVTTSHDVSAFQEASRWAGARGCVARGELEKMCEGITPAVATPPVRPRKIAPVKAIAPAFGLCHRFFRFGHCVC